MKPVIGIGGKRFRLADLERAAAAMSKASGKRFRIDTMMGGSRIVQEVGDHGGIRDTSPRMSKGELMQWIWAWWDGFNTALATMEARGVNLKIYLDAKAAAGLCPKCGSDNVAKQGEKPGSIGWTCGACGYLFETLTG
jgi:ribosomal protein S27AE